MLPLPSAERLTNKEPLLQNVVGFGANPAEEHPYHRVIQYFCPKLHLSPKWLWLEVWVWLKWQAQLTPFQPCQAHLLQQTPAKHPSSRWSRSPAPVHSLRVSYALKASATRWGFAGDPGTENTRWLKSSVHTRRSFTFSTGRKESFA